MIQTAITSLAELRNEEAFKKMADAAGLQEKVNEVEIIAEPLLEPIPKRARVQSSKLLDSVVMSTLGQSDEQDCSPEWSQLRAVYFSMLDSILKEFMEKLVDGSSEGLTCAVSALLPTSDKFLDVNDLKPLTQKQDRHDDVKKCIADEALIASRFLKNKFQPCCSLQEVMDFILDYKNAFSTLH